jgi:hypothetical protein
MLIQYQRIYSHIPLLSLFLSFLYELIYVYFQVLKTLFLTFSSKIFQIQIYLSCLIVFKILIKVNADFILDNCDLNLFPSITERYRKILTVEISLLIQFICLYFDELKFKLDPFHFLSFFLEFQYLNLFLICPPTLQYC